MSKNLFFIRKTLSILCCVSMRIMHLFARKSSKHLSKVAKKFAVFLAQTNKTHMGATNNIILVRNRIVQNTAVA